jgi:hypothetical protein
MVKTNKKISHHMREVEIGERDGGLSRERGKLTVVAAPIDISRGLFSGK